MVSYPSINLVDLTIDEVALEGLDGITIEALWLRLAHRFHETLPFPKPFMVQIWSICVQVREFMFYELKTPRDPLVIFDRYEFVDPDLGIILEPETVPKDIYAHSPVHDVVHGVKGSCATYYKRKEITEIVRRLNLDEVTKKYGQKLVIVASQAARERALIGVEICPTLELNVTQYCFLERVGRSRYHGEVTQGKLSLSALKEDPKTLFYHRKFLLRNKLITKQIHHQKNGGHSTNGSLLHLPRFFIERKPKIIFLAEQVIDILKSKPNYVAEYDEIKRKLQIENSIRKLFKTSFFQKVVRTDLKVPYRTLYPNAEPSEWQQKNNPAKEKRIRVVQLLLPDIDITEVWNKDEVQEDDDSQEVDVSNHKFNVPYLKQANDVVESSQNDGVCQGSLAKEMGLTKLQSRTLLRNLIKTKIVATYMNDIGRQRLTKFVSKKFEKGSKMSKEFKKEMHKIKELTKHITTDIEDPEKKTTNLDQNDSTSMIENKDIIKETSTPCVIDANEKNYILEVNEQPIKSALELDRIYSVVNRILSRYRLTKCVTRYKCTSFNFTSIRNKEKNLKEKDKNTNKISLSISELSNNQRASSLYKNIKTDITALKPLKSSKPVNEIFGFMEDVQNSEKKNVSNITYRLLRRANMIIQSVKEHQIIDDVTKLIKMIHEEEDKEGYDVKIDKKSLIRLLQKLAKDNLVKSIKLTLSGNGREKHLMFICDPNIDINHGVIQSAVEQAKLKFCLLISQKTKVPKKSADKMESDKGSLHNIEDTNKSDDSPVVKQTSAAPANFKYDPKAAKRYGYSPKFLRMKALHIFLYYLVYVHPGEQRLSKQEQIQALRANGFHITDELIQEFSTIYSTDINWKMFVPPLQKYNGWPQGWTLMCDVLLRIPLSIFLKVHHVPYVVPELDKYLNHPIRRFYLVRDLPVDIRNSLLFGRKYIFNIHQTVTRLCYIGLVQFGPQRLKEKDQVFIYVNHQTTLLDTTSSAPNYHIIEDKSYPVMEYKFTEMQVVEKYWYDMWNTCINTSLGGRLVVQGKDILLEDLSKKTDMINAVTARSPEEAAKLDNGQVPGDHKGAAGIDSACFAHLKRNWNWGLSNNNVTCRQPKVYQQNSVVQEREAYLSKIKAKPLKFTEFSGLKKVSGPPSVNATDLRKKAQQNNKTTENTAQQKKYEALTTIQSSKQKSFVRRVMPRKQKTRRRTKYDEIDYRALQRMHKLRVDWEPHEDKILLVCKVAMMYLCPNPRKQVVTFTAVRDVLRTYSFSSYNKTSRACQRRLLYMLRQPQTVNSVALGIEEIKQNFFIKKRYEDIMERLKEQYKNSSEYEKHVIDAFKTLVGYIAKKYYDISEIGPKEPLPVPTTAQEFNMFYKVVHPQKPFSNRGFVKDVRNINDVHSAVINSVIHSSMCCGKDRRAWAYQLFKIYQQYPEILLRNAMSKIRADQMVTVKKNHLCVIRKYGNYMPMSSSQYQLSTNYIYKFQTKWPYDIFKESYEVFFKLIQYYHQVKISGASNTPDKFNGTEIFPVTGGIIGAINDYIMQNRIDFDIEIPEQIIMLDPRLKEKDETYFRIAQRYQDVLASIDQLKLAKEPGFQNNDDKFLDCELDKLTDLDKDDAESDKNSNANNVNEYEELNFDSEDEGHNLPDEESNVIKFEDGTSIMLNNDDIRNDDATMCLNTDLTMETKQDKTMSTNNTELSKDVPEERTDITLRSTNDVVTTIECPSKPEDVSHIKHNRETVAEHTNNDLSKDKTIVEGTISSQSYQRTVIKRPRIVYEDEFDLDEPVHKNLKTSNETNISETNNDKCNENISDNTDMAVDNNVTDQNSNIKSNETEKDNVNTENANTSEVTKENVNTYTRVSDILRNISPENHCLGAYCKIDDTSDIQKRYTRIALLRMREELSQLTVADSHHAHEYFVVNMFKIFYSLCATNSDEIETFKGFSIPAELLPLRLSTANNFIQEINKFAVFPKDNISYSDYKKNLLKDTSFNLNNMDMIYKFVRDKKEIGATVQELMDKFQNSLGEDLYRIVTLLTKNHIFLRSGVTTIRYIHHRHADSWLIHSYKIYRLEKEALIPMPKGAVYITETETGPNDNDVVAESKELPTNGSSAIENISDPTSEQAVPSTSQQELSTTNHENEDGDKNQSSSSDEEREIHVKKRLHRKRTHLLPQRDISRSAKQLDFTTAEEIRVAIKPWIRIDGVLNRRVLDRMLGAILTYCLTHPGITLAKIQTRFVPALQPFHTRELVEMLIKLGCLERRQMKKQKVTLFSKPSGIRPRIIENDWASEDDIYLESSDEAVLKFGIFLSTKMYNADFIV